MISYESNVLLLSRLRICQQYSRAILGCIYLILKYFVLYDDRKKLFFIKEGPDVIHFSALFVLAEEDIIKEKQIRCWLRKLFYIFIICTLTDDNNNLLY